MARVQMPQRDRETVRFLIEQHLDHAGDAASRDICDPATAREMAASRVPSSG